MLQGAAAARDADGPEDSLDALPLLLPARSGSVAARAADAVRRHGHLRARELLHGVALAAAAEDGMTALGWIVAAGLACLYVLARVDRDEAEAKRLKAEQERDAAREAKLDTDMQLFNERILNRVLRDRLASSLTWVDQSSQHLH